MILDVSRRIAIDPARRDILVPIVNTEQTALSILPGAETWFVTSDQVGGSPVTTISIVNAANLNMLRLHPVDWSLILNQEVYLSWHGDVGGAGSDYILNASASALDGWDDALIDSCEVLPLDPNVAPDLRRLAHQFQSLVSQLARIPTDIPPTNLVSYLQRLGGKTPYP